MIDAQFEDGSIFPIEKLPAMNGKFFLTGIIQNDFSRTLGPEAIALGHGFLPGFDLLEVIKPNCRQRRLKPNGGYDVN